MDGCIVGAHVILKQPTKLRQRGDGIHVQCIEPGFFQRPELALDLCLGSSVTDLCMQKNRPDGAADEGELLIRIAAAVVDIELRRDPMGCHGVLEHFLEVIGIIVIEEAAAHQETGMVINDHDAVDSPALAVLRDKRQVTGIGLPHLPKGVFFKCLPVPHAGVACRFQVMFLHEALDGADADCGRDEGFFHEVPVDLCRVQPWEGLLEAVDLLDGRVREHPGGALIGTLLRHEGVDAAVLVEGHPFAEGLGAVLEHGAVKQGEGLFRDSLVIGVPGRIRIKAMDDRRYESEAELCHGGCVRKVFGIAVHKNVLLRWFSTIMQERRVGNHTRGVWPTEKGSGAEHLLAVKCGVFMGLEERLCKTADKGRGEI